MDEQTCEPLSVSRRINARASAIFDALCDPVNHPAFDGSGMVRSGAGANVVTKVGDVFTMKMHNDEYGDYEMINHVVAFDEGRRISWAPARPESHPKGPSHLAPGEPAPVTWTFELVDDGPDASIVTETYDCSNATDELKRVLRNGERWRESMTTSLALLDQMCASDAR